MEAQSTNLKIYVTKEGKSPFSDWLSSLKDVRGRATIRARLNRVRLGNLGDCKPVGEGVFELRIDFGPGYRVYFGQVGTETILLLSSGDKSSQQRHIRKAQQNWKDYRSRDDGQE